MYKIQFYLKSWVFKHHTDDGGRMLQTCAVTWVAETVVPVPGTVQVDESPREHGQEVVGLNLDPCVDPEMSSTVNLQPSPSHGY